MAVAAIVALGAACLAGSPLYLSSVGSAAVQNELRHTCPSAGLPVLVGVLVSLAVLVIVGFVMIKRTRAIEVMRGTA